MLVQNDGLRVDRPTEYVVICHNITRHGGGIISFGSETSGGIRHIVAYNNRGIGTNECIRFKSAKKISNAQNVESPDTPAEQTPANPKLNPKMRRNSEKFLATKRHKNRVLRRFKVLPNVDALSLSVDTPN